MVNINNNNNSAVLQTGQSQAEPSAWHNRHFSLADVGRETTALTLPRVFTFILQGHRKGYKTPSIRGKCGI